MKLKIKECDIRPVTENRRSRTTSRVYVFVDEGKPKTVLNLLTDRWTNPVADYRKQVIPEVLKQMGCPTAKIRWSQYAGCSCPCSPGFIVSQPGIPKDVFVTVFNPEPELL